jgi:predicted RNA binding protein YcfA (HicA-like mRNA interferase family)
LSGNEEAIGNSATIRSQGTVTIAGRPGDELHPKTLASILKQAQLER